MGSRGQTVLTRNYKLVKDICATPDQAVREILGDVGNPPLSAVYLGYLDGDRPHAVEPLEKAGGGKEMMDRISRSESLVAKWGLSSNDVLQPPIPILIVKSGEQIERYYTFAPDPF